MKNLVKIKINKEIHIKNIVKTNILGLQITHATAKEVLEYVSDFLEKPLDKNNKLQIFTPNPEMIVSANKHSGIKKILNQAQINLPDGVGLTWAAWFLGQPVKERIAGVDFMLMLCAICNEKPINIGLLGAGPGVAERTSHCLKARFPNLQIVFVQEEWLVEQIPKGDEQKVNDKQDKEANITLSNLKTTSLDILFVAFGFPKQEAWIAQNLPYLPIKVAMAVGGSFDYISGEVSRAPLLMRRIGLEWLYRLIRQPWRWKRQLALIEFITLVLQEKLRKS